MRILHTADWHLGKLFYGVHLTGDQIRFFETEFLPLTRDLRPDLVVVAGDVFDRPVPSAEAVGLFGEILARLHETGARILLIPGNHDHRERLAFARELFARLRIHVAEEAEYLFDPLRMGRVSLTLAPHLTPLHLKELLRRRSLSGDILFSEPGDLWSMALAEAGAPEGTFRVFVGHLFVEGGQRGDSETDLWVGGEEALPASLFHRFHLVLLGHLHRHQQPAPGLYYAGSPYPLSFADTETPKGVLVFEVDPHRGSFSAEFVPLAPPREMRVLRGSFSDLLAHPPTQAYVKIVLEDETPVPQAFERLKRRFPGLLVLETPYLRGVSGGTLAGSEVGRTDPRALFAAFVREVAGRAPSSEEEKLFEEALQRLNEAPSP
ncbi:exonuclease SbcCD subunit D [Thermosulfurimonas sp. F29]|uniref:exonuclease SbcCD subunit D n=1 Tax=Thermosulfurimonas sp. F29 TaxID=2867247 RepID=UPI001C83384B|nr:exonuclease SbcCD subunit D [Thermosulfurimonas sp. F29]MBX6423993.1 exonuclease SbcCD subunit D [Thermosulfurimonas sp. F29]